MKMILDILTLMSLMGPSIYLRTQKMHGDEQNAIFYRNEILVKK